MEEVKDLTKKFQPDFVIIESGGDNLAANYSRELADFIIYVIDVAGKLRFYQIQRSSPYFSQLVIKKIYEWCWENF